jgi:hypothetical protein
MFCGIAYSGGGGDECAWRGMRNCQIHLDIKHSIRIKYNK